jgi:TPP-dependent trihydroxycyclohexane-1,2-dione (THcHDO) dehydratase
MVFIRSGLPGITRHTNQILFFSIMPWPVWELVCHLPWQRKWYIPKRNVMAVCGDGGFMMNSQELETAVRLKLNLVILVLCDKSYGMIKWKQVNMGF